MQYDFIFHVRNVPVYVRELPSGDISIWHPYNDFTRSVVEPVCRDRGHWNGGYRNWIVFAYFKGQVLKELGKI